MKKVLSKSKNSPNLVRPNRHKKPAPLPQEPDAIEKIRKATEGHAERARVNGFIQLGYLPHIFVQDKQYSDVLLDRLWEYFECDRVPEARCSKTKCEMWFWIFDRWCGITEELWKDCSPTDHLPLYDSETRGLKKERYGGRSDLDIVMLEDLKKGIEKINKNMDIDFPLPSLLFPEAKDEKKAFECSDDFRTINKDGVEYTLTPNQARVIEILVNHWKKGATGVGQGHIIQLVSPYTSTKRLRDIFKSNLTAWSELIERGEKKGIYRLKR